MRQYYIHDGQMEKGPFLLQELSTQHLSASTPVWYEGLAEWTTVDKVSELAILLNTPPPFQPNRASTPPPINVAAAAPAPVYETPATEKRSYRLPIIIASLAIVGIIGWLVYKNQSQASQIQEQGTQLEHIQNEQIESETKRQQINEALTKKNMEYRNNWTKYIGVGKIYYNAARIGGIDPFDLPIMNNTDYTLEEVQVTISYIKANGDIHVKKAVTLYNIPPHEEKYVQAPGNGRGVSIDTEITGIYSKKMHFCYPKNNGNPADPYFCK